MEDLCVKVIWVPIGLRSYMFIQYFLVKKPFGHILCWGTYKIKKKKAHEMAMDYCLCWGCCVPYNFSCNISSSPNCQFPCFHTKLQHLHGYRAWNASFTAILNLIGVVGQPDFSSSVWSVKNINLDLIWSIWQVNSWFD
jgi:hypothetical protein